MGRLWSTATFFPFFCARRLRALVLCQASPVFSVGSGLSLSVRDLISWTGFITSSLSVGESDTNTGTDISHADGDGDRLQDPSGCASSTVTSGHGGGRGLRPWEAYVHGAALVLLDGLGLGSGVSVTSVRRLRAACAVKLAEQVSLVCISVWINVSDSLTDFKWLDP